MIAGKTAILPRSSRLHCCHVCIWADDVCLRTRIEPEAGCSLVSIGATPEGRTSLRGFQVEIRESAQRWRECPGLPLI